MSANESAKPTAGPWHVFKGGNFVKVAAVGYEEYIEEHHNLAGPFCVADVEYRATEDYDDDPKLALANARLIVRAVNAHEALLSLLKEVVPYLDEEHEFYERVQDAIKLAEEQS